MDQFVKYNSNIRKWRYIVQCICIVCVIWAGTAGAQISDILGTDTPNAGRIKINNNFDYVETQIDAMPGWIRDSLNVYRTDGLLDTVAIDTSMWEWYVKLHQYNELNELEDVAHLPLDAYYPKDLVWRSETYDDWEMVRWVDFVDTLAADTAFIDTLAANMDSLYLWNAKDSLAATHFFVDAGSWYPRQAALDSLGEFVAYYRGLGLYLDGDSVRLDLGPTPGLVLLESGVALDDSDIRNHDWTAGTENFSTSGSVTAGTAIRAGTSLYFDGVFAIKDSSDTDRTILDYIEAAEDYIVVGNSLFDTKFRGGNATDAIVIDEGVTTIDELLLNTVLSTDYFSAYSDLSAESKIGTGSAQVAAGDHTHGQLFNLGDSLASSHFYVTGGTYYVRQAGMDSLDNYENWLLYLNSSLEATMGSGEALDFQDGYGINLTMPVQDDVVVSVDTTEIETKAYTSNNYQPLGGDLTSLDALIGTGLVTRTASETFALRSIAGGTGISVSNSSGISGNPTVSFAYDWGLTDYGSDGFVDVDSSDVASKSYVNNNFDDYDSWDLQLNSVQAANMASGDALSFDEGWAMNITEPTGDHIQFEADSNAIKTLIESYGYGSGGFDLEDSLSASYFYRNAGWWYPRIAALEDSIEAVADHDDFQGFVAAEHYNRSVSNTYDLYTDNFIVEASSEQFAKFEDANSDNYVAFGFGSTGENFYLNFYDTGLSSSKFPFKAYRDTVFVSELKLTRDLIADYISYDHGLTDYGSDGDLDVDSTVFSSKTWSNNNFDNYGSWNLEINSAQAMNFTSGEALDVTEGWAMNITEPTGDELNVEVDSSAIKTLIESYGYGTGSGDITGVTAGNGLTGGGTSGDVTLTLGTPSSVTATSINHSTGSTHSHAVSGLTTSEFASAAVSQWTNDAGYITATLTDEEVEDVVGGMVASNTETGIAVTYQDGATRTILTVDTTSSGGDQIYIGGGAWEELKFFTNDKIVFTGDLESVSDAEFNAIIGSTQWQGADITAPYIDYEGPLYSNSGTLGLQYVADDFTVTVSRLDLNTGAVDWAELDSAVQDSIQADYEIHRVIVEVTEKDADEFIVKCTRKGTVISQDTLSTNSTSNDWECNAAGDIIYYDIKTALSLTDVEDGFINWRYTSSVASGFHHTNKVYGDYNTTSDLSSVAITDGSDMSDTWVSVICTDNKSAYFEVIVSAY